uniref:beta-ketoacyl reductase n=1 Tax=Nocardia sp. CNY236 TaxID=1169152 RepID=UPI00048E84DC
GARHLTLLGRSGATTEAAEQQLAIWQLQGIEVTTELADAGDADAVAAAIARAHTPEHPLKGFIHTAGILDDVKIGAMTRESLDKVLAPKIDGCHAVWNGLRAAGVNPDFLVLFSSGSSIFGGVGQYSYTAANLAVRSFAEVIAREGANVLSVGWGHMTGAGMLANDDNLTRYLVSTGLDRLDMEESTQYLEEALRLGVTRVDLSPINWSRILATGGERVLATGRLKRVIENTEEKGSASVQLRTDLLALEEAKRNEVVAFMLAEQLAGVMGVNADAIDLTVPVPELGLDSLMAVEFGSLVSQRLDIDLTSLKLGRSFSLEQAGAVVAKAIIERAGSRSMKAEPTSE